MSFDNVQIRSTLNGINPVNGYREDLAGGDVIVLALTDTRGVFSYTWSLVGRPEFGVAGGAGPNPWALGTSPTATFVADSDSGSVHLDGSYKVACTINQGAPNETVLTTVLCRLSGLTIVGPLGPLPLRKLAPFEALEDTSAADLLAGWATQINRWLEKMRTCCGPTPPPPSTSEALVLDAYADQDPGHTVSSSSANRLVAEWGINFDDLPTGSLQYTVTGVGTVDDDTPGNGEIRVYVGANPGTLVGNTLVVAAGFTAITPTAVAATDVLANPGGLGVIQLSVADVAGAQMTVYGLTVTVVAAP